MHKLIILVATRMVLSMNKFLVLITVIVGKSTSLNVTFGSGAVSSGCGASREQPHTLWQVVCHLRFAIICSLIKPLPLTAQFSKFRARLDYEFHRHSAEVLDLR